MKTKISNKKIKELRETIEFILSDEEVEKIININKNAILRRTYCATQSNQSKSGVDQTRQNTEPACLFTGEPGIPACTCC